jgi:hypothetical protein
VTIITSGFREEARIDQAKWSNYLVDVVGAESRATTYFYETSGIRSGARLFKVIYALDQLRDALDNLKKL